MAESVQHIVDRIRTIHQQLAERVEKLSGQPLRERALLILDYVGRHERNLAEALRQYESTASRAVLDSWFKNTPGRPLEECLDYVRLDAAEPADLLRSVLEMDRCLVESFRRIAESAASQAVRDFFQKLIELEENSEKQLIRDTIELDDL